MTTVRSSDDYRDIWEAKDRLVETNDKRLMEQLALLSKENETLRSGLLVRLKKFPQNRPSPDEPGRVSPHPENVQEDGRIKPGCFVFDDLTSRFHEVEIKMLLLRSRIYIALKDNNRAEALAEEAGIIAGNLGYEALTGRCAYYYGLSQMKAGKFEEAQDALFDATACRRRYLEGGNVKTLLRYVATKLRESGTQPSSQITRYLQRPMSRWSAYGAAPATPPSTLLPDSAKSFRRRYSAPNRESLPDVDPVNLADELADLDIDSLGGSRSTSLASTATTQDHRSSIGQRHSIASQRLSRQRSHSVTSVGSHPRSRHASQDFPSAFSPGPRSHRRHLPLRSSTNADVTRPSPLRDRFDRRNRPRTLELEEPRRRMSRSRTPTPLDRATWSEVAIAELVEESESGSEGSVAAEGDVSSAGDLAESSGGRESVGSWVESESETADSSVSTQQTRGA